MSTKRKSKTQPSNTWVCPHCEGQPEFEHPEMMKHLKEVHGVKEMKGNRSMRMHADGADFALWQYDWEIEGKVYHQTTVTAR